MRIKLKRLLPLSLTALMIASSSSVDAQFLDKLSKGLKKVNKALDQTEKVLKGNRPESKSKTEKTTKASITTIDDDILDINPKELDVKKINSPHFTEQTKFLLLDPNEYSSNFYHYRSLTNVSEGIFAIQNMKGRWSFYNVETGECLFHNIGSDNGNTILPYFNNGVAVVRDKTEKKNFNILYADGRMKELNKSYVNIEDFVDGISMVKTFDEKYIPSVYYIDINCNKIYPELAKTGKRIGELITTQDIRPLKDGLRAIKKDGKYGFIDATGTIIIKPIYTAVRDFSEGYAWVCLKEGTEAKIGLIDTSGNWAFTPKHKGSDLEIIPEDFGDNNNNIVRVNEDNDLVYYSTTGEELARFPGGYGTDFYCGYAFISQAKDNSYVVNTDFEVVNFIDDSKGAWNITYKNPSFPNYPLAITNFHRSACTPKGETAIRHKYNTENLQLREFSKDGYAYAETIFNNKVVRGFIRPNGEYTIVLALSEKENYKWDPTEENPWCDNDTKVITTVIPGIPGINILPSPKYTVTTIANPPEGGIVSNGGDFEYGDTYTLSANANKDWTLASVEPSLNNATTTTPLVYNVFNNLTLTANFIKRDIINAPSIDGIWKSDKGIDYQNPEKETLHENIPVYLEVSSQKNISTPYGDKYGVLTFIFDTNKKYRSGDKTNTHGGSVYSLMHIPFAIEGEIIKDGKSYLLIDGGELKVGNIYVEDGTKDGGINAFFANILLKLFGDNININSGSYLLEYTKKDGNIHLGEMLQFHPSYGWITAGDKRFAKLSQSGIMWGVETGYPADYFDTLVLTPNKTRSELDWYTPKSWLYNSDNYYDAMRKEFDKLYKSYISDYFLYYKNHLLEN